MTRGADRKIRETKDITEIGNKFLKSCDKIMSNALATLRLQEETMPNATEALGEIMLQTDVKIENHSNGLAEELRTMQEGIIYNSMLNRIVINPVISGDYADTDLTKSLTEFVDNGHINSALDLLENKENILENHGHVIPGRIENYLEKLETRVGKKCLETFLSAVIDKKQESAASRFLRNDIFDKNLVGIIGGFVGKLEEEEKEKLNKGLNK